MDRPTPDRLDRPGLSDLQSRRLRSLLAQLVPANPFWTRTLERADLHPSNIQSLADLPRLPLLDKHQLVDDQRANPPYGTNLTFPLTRYTRLHQTSGTRGGTPLNWLDTPESWDWFLHCWQLIYDAAGVRPDDRFYFPFSFGPFIGFWAAFEGAQRRGNFCLSGAGLTTAARVDAILTHAITVLCCTPTYALRLAQAAAEQGRGLAASTLRLAIVAGEPGGSLPGVRDAIERGLGARVIDHTGMTEIGSLGVECLENPGAVHLLETECIPELIEPTGAALLYSPGADAQHLPNVRSALPEPLEGELVLTNLGRVGSPLLRYRTGDVVRLQTGRCACGRHTARMVGGIIGRSDDMLIIRGNNVYPSAIDSLVRQVEGIAEYQIVVHRGEGLSALTIKIEPSGAGVDPRRLATRLKALIHDRLAFRADVVPVSPGALPRFEAKARRVVHE